LEHRKTVGENPFANRFFLQKACYNGVNSQADQDGKSLTKECFCKKNKRFSQAGIL
jgi:hypothetical protein